MAEAAELDTLVRLVWTLRAIHGYQGGLDHYARGAELARRLGRPEIELEMQWGEWAGYDTKCEEEDAAVDREQAAHEVGDDLRTQKAHSQDEEGLDGVGDHDVRVTANLTRYRCARVRKYKNPRLADCGLP